MSTVWSENTVALEPTVFMSSTGDWLVRQTRPGPSGEGPTRMATAPDHQVPWHCPVAMFTLVSALSLLGNNLILQGGKAQRACRV